MALYFLRYTYKNKKYYVIMYNVVSRDIYRVLYSTYILHKQVCIINKHILCILPALKCKLRM